MSQSQIHRRIQSQTGDGRGLERRARRGRAKLYDRMLQLVRLDEDRANSDLPTAAAIAQKLEAYRRWEDLQTRKPVSSFIKDCSCEVESYGRSLPLQR